MHGAAPVRETPGLAPGDRAGAAPLLADGIELIGEYKGSGFKETPYVVRRPDGQVVQLPALLYLIAERLDGRSLGQVAEEVSAAYGRGLEAEDVEFLVEKKLEPLGLLAGGDGQATERPRIDPMLALKFRVALVPESIVNAIARIFRPLFLPPVVVAALGGLVILDVWLFGVHGVGQSVRDILYQPILLLLLLGLITLSAAFHECGHATACAYGGARPGTMGAGIYLVWPAFYTDVTDAYRLGKGGRLRTDLGGVYFNVVFILATAGAYFATGYEPLLLVIPIQHLEIIHQFLPFLRLDGYYIVSDLTGVPDMFSRIKPTLKSLIPFREPDPRVRELKLWARAAVTAYVLTVVPLLLFMFGMMIMATPRIFATAWSSFAVQLDKAQLQFGHGNAAAGVLSCIQMAALLLPVGGIVLMFARTGKRAGAAAWTITEERPAARAMVLASGTALAAAVAFLWWPSGGTYQGIRPGGRGTFHDALYTFRQHYTHIFWPHPAPSPSVPATPTTPAPTLTQPAPEQTLTPTDRSPAPPAPAPTATTAPATSTVRATTQARTTTPSTRTAPATTTKTLPPAGITAPFPTATVSGAVPTPTETLPTETVPNETTPTDTTPATTTPTDTSAATTEAATTPTSPYP